MKYLIPLQLVIITSMYLSNTGEIPDQSNTGEKLDPSLISSILNLNASSIQKKHACTYCEKTFVRKYSRKRHELMHTREVILKCLSCEHETTDKSNLKKHFLRKHPNKAFLVESNSHYKEIRKNGPLKTIAKNHRNRFSTHTLHNQGGIPALSLPSSQLPHSYSLAS